MWPFDRKKKQREFVRSLGKRYPFTPDMAELEQASHRLLFVCDDMMVPHVNHKLIKGHSAKIARAFTQHKFDYRMGKNSGKGLPMLVGNNRDGLRVKGEIHAVESGHFDALDRHYRNGVEFARVDLKVIVTDRDHQMIDIGNEYFIRRLPPGMIRTVPELGIRHYISNPHVHLVSVKMYVARRSFWLKEPDADKMFPIIKPQFPAQPFVWLKEYYKYPIERNRCPR